MSHTSCRLNILQVKIGMSTEEEELDDSGKVLHNDQNAIRVSWNSRDSESGIISYVVAIGTHDDPEMVLAFSDYGTETTAYIDQIHFETTTASNLTYIVSVKALNGAGLESKVGRSKDIYIQKANVPGIVFDGRSLFMDESFTTDHTSIAASFYGFESESCSIVSYDWAIGTSEFGTNILTYTDFGLVMLNETHGQAQIHTELIENVQYFITVRAVTGCHDEYIVSSSDGIVLDRTAPAVQFLQEETNDTKTFLHNDVFYQSNIDSINIEVELVEKNKISSARWALGSLPLLDDRSAFTDDLAMITSSVILVPGETIFLSASLEDEAGNKNQTASFAVVADNTPPVIDQLSCDPSISYRKSLVICTWEAITEDESLIKSITLSLGSNKTNSDLLQMHEISPISRSFKFDVLHFIDSLHDIKMVYVTIVVRNVVQLTSTYGREITVDRTSPTATRLDVVTSVGNGIADTHQTCQLPTRYLEARLIDAKDEESGVDTNR